MNDTIKGNYELASLIELVRGVQARNDAVRRDFANLLPLKCDAWHPIPFFGQLPRATVLTAAMNPSADELRGGRWPQSLSAEAVVSRLLNYFSNPTHAPHPWFQRTERPLQSLGRHYAENVAHIDVVCRATRTIDANVGRDFLRLADEEADVFFSALAAARNARVLIVSGSVTKARYAHEHIARHAESFGWRFTPKAQRLAGGAFTSTHELRHGDRVLPMLFTSASVNRRGGAAEYERLVEARLDWLDETLRG